MFYCEKNNVEVEIKVYDCKSRIWENLSLISCEKSSKILDNIGKIIEQTIDSELNCILEELQGKNK